jgi:putative endonuclease
MSDKVFCVYILTNPANKVLYVGMTSDLGGRMYQHKHGLTPGFTSKYEVTKLVYFEETSDPSAAIEREKQLKRWRRSKKIWLIEKQNPDWTDLYHRLFPQ